MWITSPGIQFLLGGRKIAELSLLCDSQFSAAGIQILLSWAYYLTLSSRYSFQVELVKWFSAPGIPFLLKGMVITELSLFCDCPLLVFNFDLFEGVIYFIKQNK